MTKLTPLICLILLSAVVCAQRRPNHDPVVDLKTGALLLDLKNLALEIPKLDGGLARALAKAEIADAAWSLDPKWSKALLREAYQLTYLTEEEFQQVGPRKGSSLIFSLIIEFSLDFIRRQNVVSCIILG
jgi:hypothetical protein